MTTHLIIRLDFEFGRLGPNKIALLETVAETGSFKAAARAHNVSYRYAWLQIDEVNRLFAEPVVVAHRGGQKGGGVSLTDWGRRVVTLFRDAEAKMRLAGQGEIDAIERDLAAIEPGIPVTDYADCGDGLR